MVEVPLTFSDWRALAKESPTRAVDTFYERLRMLSPIARNSLIAAIPAQKFAQKTYEQTLTGDSLPLTGIPYVFQDMIDVKGLTTRCGAPFKGPFELPADKSSLLYRTLRDLGASFFAKTVPAEFGVDLKGTNATNGSCPHAEGINYVCGGGAGASIRLVRDGFVPLAFGLDTFGGIRVPAAFHGLFGFRMANNEFSRDGIFPIIPTIESIGWVNKTASDLRETFKAFYPHASLPLAENEKIPASPKGYRLQDVAGFISHDVKAGILCLSRALEIDEDPAIGKELFLCLKGARKSLKTLMSRELHSIHQYWIEEYRDAYDIELLLTIERGMDCSFAAAEECVKIQESIRMAFTKFFAHYDYLIMPICPDPNPIKDVWNRDLEQEIIQLIAPVSLVSLPAIIVPVRCSKGRHSAVQLIVNPKKIGMVPLIIEQLMEHFGELPKSSETVEESSDETEESGPVEVKTDRNEDSTGEEPVSEVS